MADNRITVTSSSFQSEGTIPTRHTKDGDDLSPPLEWSGVPEEARAQVVIVDDPDAPGTGTFTHWLVYGLPANVRRLPEGVPVNSEARGSGGVAQGVNSFRMKGYGGPSPPPGAPHRYRFIVCALDQEIEVKPGATRRELQAAIEGHVIARGELVGVYGRPPLH